MAITHVASAAGSTSNPTVTDSVTLSASIEADDILLVAVHNRYGDQGVVLEGVTDNDTGGNAWALKGTSANGRLTVWWKRATSATAGKVVTATVDQSAAVLMGYSAYRGAYSAGDPITDLTFEANASGNETHAGFTPSNDDSWVFLVVAPMNDVTVSSQATATSPGSLAERFDKISSAAQDHGLSLASAEQAGTATATGNFTWAQTNVEGDSAVFALRPEATGTTHQATATTSVTVTGAASGRAVHRATATSTVTVTGSATAHAVRHATATATVTVTATASGQSQPRRATATAQITVTGAATGRKVAKATGSTSVSVTGSATGRAVHRATATTQITVTGTATGAAVIPPKQATATATITITGQATGKAVRKTTAAAQLTVTTTAKGWVPREHASGVSLLEVTTTEFSNLIVEE